jgi:hypothetical protein
MDSCSTSQAEHGILWPAEILRLFRWSGHVLVESIPVVDLALESSNDKLARSVPALLANFIQLSNDSGWEIQGRRHSDDLLKLFPQQQLFEISQRVGFFHGSVGWVTPRDSLKFQERSKQNGEVETARLRPVASLQNAVYIRIQRCRNTL